jgi:hypothetical protein
MVRKCFQFEAGRAILCCRGKFGVIGEVHHLREATFVVDGGRRSDVVGNAFQNADRRKRNGFPAASGHGLRRPCVWTDNKNGFELLLIERKQRAIVLEQHNAFARTLKGNEVILFVIFRKGEIGLFAIEPTESGRGGQDVAHLSSMVDSFTRPSRIAGSRSFWFMYLPFGISRSSPPLAAPTES